MKVVVLHGPAISASRKKLIEIKQQFDQNNVVYFEEGSDLQTILGSLVTPSLFSGQQLIILENPNENFLPTTNYQLPTTLLLWFDHEVKKLPGDIQVFFFPESKEISVFPFLDYLATKNKRAFVELDKLKQAGFDTQYFITMIFYLLRNLVVTPAGAKEFVINKNAEMRKNFVSEELGNLYKFVLEVDFKIKSGLLEKPQAEFLLVNRFIGN